MIAEQTMTFKDCEWQEGENNQIVKTYFLLSTHNVLGVYN